jgi:hypothetical protein
MCGRFTFQPTEAVCARFETTNRLDSLMPCYNIAPGQMVPVIIAHSPRQMVLMRWGLIPHWPKDEKAAYKMINALVETLTQRPAFWGLLSHNRALVPACGYYEWQGEGRDKTPYYIHPQSLLANARLEAPCRLARPPWLPLPQPRCPPSQDRRVSGPVAGCKRPPTHEPTAQRASMLDAPAQASCLAPCERPDAEGEHLAPLLPGPAPRGRPRRGAPVAAGHRHLLRPAPRLCLAGSPAGVFTLANRRCAGAPVAAHGRLAAETRGLTPGRADPGGPPSRAVRRPHGEPAHQDHRRLRRPPGGRRREAGERAAPAWARGHSWAAAVGVCHPCPYRRPGGSMPPAGRAQPLAIPPGIALGRPRLPRRRAGPVGCHRR